MSHIPSEKAHWTPSYHKTFVDLCLDETLKGNKPATYFTKEGWNNIVESFYERTGSRYDLKQMKNHWALTKLRWKTWVKLIGDSSMKWDPETKKLGATKEDWARYIKANPEAVHFQFTELQNIDKLEIILNGTINGALIHVPTRYKRNNCCLISSPLYVKEEAVTTPTVKKEHLPDDELRSAVMTQSTQGIQFASEQSMSISSPSNEKAIWTPFIHKIFIDLCLEQKLKGNKPGTCFTKEGWRTIFGSFQKKTGLSYETLQLKNHWNVTKERWKVWSNLIGTPSMKWDPNTNKFGASAENWEEYLQANPAASPFRFKKLELADKLETIFDGSTVTAETEPTSQRRKYNNASTMPHLSNQKLELPDKLETIFDGSTVTAETEPTSQRRKDNNASTMPHLSNREPEIPKPDEQTERSCDAVESRDALVIQKEAQCVPSRGGKLSYSIGECIDCLDGMEEIEPGSDLYLFALDTFLKKEYREVFLQLKNPSVRMAWLQRQQSIGPSL